MARSAQDVERALQSSIASVDPSIDTEIGPIYDVFIAPQAPLISEVESEVEILARRYSVDYVKTLGDADITLFGANHGLRRTVGTPAFTVGGVRLFAYTAPRSGQVLTIPIGTLVSTEDGSLVYATTAEVTVTQDTIALYYNERTRRYEVPVDVRAEGLGDEYAVPPGRIRILLTNVPGFDGVVQVGRVQQGLTAVSNDSFMETCRKTLVGSALGSLAGLEALILQFGSGAISSLSIVSSSDPVNFRRHTRRAACDVWILGTSPKERTETQVASAGQTIVYPQIQPVMSVIGVAVDGTQVPFIFVKDGSERTFNSIYATDQIVLATPTTLGQILTLQYVYDGMVQATQAYVDNRTSTTQADTVPVVRAPRLYDCDIRMRAAIRVPVKITVSLLVLSSYNDVQAAQDAQSALIDFANPSQFTSQLLPEAARAVVENAAVGASSVTMLEFQREDRTGLRVDALEFGPQEIPYADETTVTVRVRRA